MNLNLERKEEEGGVGVEAGEGLEDTIVAVEVVRVCLVSRVMVGGGTAEGGRISIGSRIATPIISIPRLSHFDIF